MNFKNIFANPVGSLRKAYTTKGKNSAEENEVDVHDPKTERGLSLILKSFKNLEKGKDASGYGRKYIDTINKTKGEYSKRGTQLVGYMAQWKNTIKSNYTDDQISGTILQAFCEIHEVVTDKKWSKAFSKAYKLEKKNDAAKLITIRYVMLVYAMEYIATTMYSTVMEDVSNSVDATVVNGKYCSNNGVFVSGVVVKIAPLVKLSKSLRDPKTYVDKLIKSQTRQAGSEEGINEMLILGVAIAVPAILALWNIRSIIYHVSCLTVDLSETLVDQSFTLLIGIEEMKAQLATLKEGSKEYKELEYMIEKQQKYATKIAKVASKIAGAEVETLDEIRARDAEDTEIIDDIEDEDTVIEI